jgi:VanZ family protein
LLAYLLFLIAVATMLPFRFRWPTHVDIGVITNEGDILNNICLFLPLGMLYRLMRNGQGDPWCTRSLLFGAALSIGIELTQLFLRGRFTSVADVLSNSAGAWAGAMLYHHLGQRLPARQVWPLRFDLPSMNLCYLLLPLLWLNGLALGNSPSRLGLAALLGVCGSTMLVTVWTHHLRPARGFSASRLAVVAALWFLVGTLPALVRYPQFLVPGILGVALAVRLVAAVQPCANQRAQPFASVALQRLWLPYMTYVGLLMLWPWKRQYRSWRAAIGFAEMPDDTGPVPILRILEDIAAFTFLGYMFAEYYRRCGKPFRHTLVWLVVGGVLISGFLELARGFHTQHIASLAHVLLTLGAVLYGAVIHRLQFVPLRQLLRDSAMSKRQAQS